MVKPGDVSAALTLIDPVEEKKHLYVETSADRRLRAAEIMSGACEQTGIDSALVPWKARGRAVSSLREPRRFAAVAAAAVLLLGVGILLLLVLGRSTVEPADRPATTDASTTAPSTGPSSTATGPNGGEGSTPGTPGAVPQPETGSNPADKSGGPGTDEPNETAPECTPVGLEAVWRDYTQASPLGQQVYAADTIAPGRLNCSGRYAEALLVPAGTSPCGPYSPEAFADAPANCVWPTTVYFAADTAGKWAVALANLTYVTCSQLNRTFVDWPSEAQQYCKP